MHFKKKLNKPKQIELEENCVYNIHTQYINHPSLSSMKLCTFIYDNLNQPYKIVC